MEKKKNLGKELMKRLERFNEKLQATEDLYEILSFYSIFSKTFPACKSMYEKLCK